MAIPAPEHLLETAIRAARLGAVELRAAYGSVLQISEKAHARDLVTQVDLASERAILPELAEVSPEIGLLAEETGKTRAGAQATWIVDPLDGTLNFAHGYPVFVVSIACVDRSGPLVGVILDPFRDELFTAIRGEGAYLNGSRIRVSSVRGLAGGLFSTGLPYFPPERRRQAGAVLTEVMVRAADGRRSGSAATDLAYVAAGRQEAHYELILAPHDVAAGVLFILEAGGRVEALASPGRQGWLPGILATNGSPLHEESAELICAPLGVQRHPISFEPVF